MLVIRIEINRRERMRIVQLLFRVRCCFCCSQQIDRHWCCNDRRRGGAGSTSPMGRRGIVRQGSSSDCTLSKEISTDGKALSIERGMLIEKRTIFFHPTSEGKYKKALSLSLSVEQKKKKKKKKKRGHEKRKKLKSRLSSLLSISSFRSVSFMVID